jgi:hypothetical protein
MEHVESRGMDVLGVKRGQTSEATLEGIETA